MDFSKKKIGKLIHMLSKKEELRFRLFLKSPYFIGPEYQKSLTRLFDFLIKELKGKGKIIVMEQYFAQEVFKEEQVIKGKVDKFLSLLYKMILQFIGYERLKTTESPNIAAMTELRLRGESSLWKNQFNKVNRSLKKDRNKSYAVSLDILQLALEGFNFRNLDSRNTSEDSYLAILDAYDNFYVDNVLNIGLQVLTYNEFIVPLKLQGRFRLLKKFLSEREREDHYASEIIKEEAFYLLDNVKSATDVDINAFLHLLKAHQNNIPLPTYSYLRAIARSFVIHLYNNKSDDVALPGIVFEMYKEDIQNESIFFNGKLPATSLNNITTIALRNKKIDWIASFITQQENNILEKEIEYFTISLNKSKVLFAQRKFQEALDNLSFEVQDFYLKINARILELMTFFELKGDQLSFKIESFKLFIYRLPKGAMSSQYVLGHNNFIDILKNICHPKTIYNSIRIQKLKIKIVETVVLVEKEWLLEKIKELEVANDK